MPEQLIAKLASALTNPLTRRSALGTSFAALAASFNSSSFDAKKRKRKDKAKKKRSKGSAGQNNCSGTYVDLSSDRLHCGECDNECWQDQQICRGGVCTVPCTEHACLEKRFGDDYFPYQVTAAPDGTLVTIATDDQLAIFQTTGQLVRTLGEYGIDPGEFANPAGIAVGQDSAIYVADYDNDRLQILHPNGDIDVWPLASFDRPNRIAVTASGTVYVAFNDQINRFSPTGSLGDAWGPDGTAGTTFDEPTALATDAGGELYVVDGYVERVYRFTDHGNGNVQRRWVIGAPGIDPGEFRDPEGVTVSSGRVFVADTNNSRIQVHDAEDGAFLFNWPTTDEYGSSVDPDGIAIHANGLAFVSADGDIYVYSLKT